jgi:hypothetical protein
MKLLIMQFSITTCPFILLWWKYSQHLLLKHPQYVPPLMSKTKIHTNPSSAHTS